MLLAGIIFAASPGGVSAQANSSPNFVPRGATFHVYGYTPGGAEFWTPQTAIDEDGDTLIYSLSGTDSSSFSIDSSTGQLSLAPGTNLDADTKNTYYITIAATDTSNDTGTKTVTVEVRKCEQGLGIWCGTVDASASNPDVQFKGYWEEHSNQTVHTGDPFGELMPRKVVSFGGSDFDVVFVAEDKDADKVQFHLDEKLYFDVVPRPAGTGMSPFYGYGLKVGSNVLAFPQGFPDPGGWDWTYPGLPGMTIGNDYGVAS